MSNINGRLERLEKISGPVQTVNPYVGKPRAELLQLVREIVEDANRRGIEIKEPYKTEALQVLAAEQEQREKQ